MVCAVSITCRNVVGNVFSKFRRLFSWNKPVLKLVFAVFGCLPTSISIVLGCVCRTEIPSSEGEEPREVQQQVTLYTAYIVSVLRMTNSDLKKAGLFPVPSVS